MCESEKVVAEIVVFVDLFEFELANALEINFKTYISG